MGERFINLLYFKKLLAIFLIISFIAMVSNISLADGSVYDNVCKCKTGNELVYDLITYDKVNSYSSVFDSLVNKKSVGFPKWEKILNAKDASFNIKQVKNTGNYKGASDVLLWEEKGSWVDWKVDVPEEGMYNIALCYISIPKDSGEFEVAVKINGEYPFNEAENMTLHRVWKDDGEITTDNRGNQIRPKQVEVYEWQECILSDHEGLNEGEYYFYFKKGINTISLKIDRGLMALGYLKIFHYDKPKVYEEVLKHYKKSGYKESSNYFRKVQAENTYQKSSQLIHPIYDRSAGTEPTHHSKIVLNTIGGNNWKYVGQWVSWKIDVPEDGLYNIGMRCIQNINVGFPSVRKVYIDGKVPFKEMEQQKIYYDYNWQIKLLGPTNDNPYLFYLTKGTHEIKMEVVLGDFSNVLRMTQEIVLLLNNIYRKVIMVTGTKPDTYRDYYLEESIPGLEEDLQDALMKVDLIEKEFGIITLKNDSATSIVKQIKLQLENYIDDCDLLVKGLDAFKSNISSLAAWILQLKDQPLQVDYIFIKSPDYKLPDKDVWFGEKVVFELKSFIASYFEDYTSIGNVYNEGKEKDILKVWISTGRDQAQILKTLIDNEFVPKTGIPVNLSLVQGSLVQAILAGKGPDVALSVSRGQPVNLAMRGVLVDLSQFDDYEEIMRRFHPRARIPYKYEGGYYALPETQDFYMMFYRKDILGSMGINPPNTWDEVYTTLIELQKNNLEFGLPYQLLDAQQAVGAGMGINNIYPTLLLQRGVRLYNDELNGTNLHDERAIEAFDEWTKFYNDFEIPLIYDFYNRFRTGEMPIAIQRFTQYNLLSVAAPEIKNLWEMVPLPGVRKEDGKIDRTTCTTGSSAIIIKNKERKDDDAWTFLKWWTSAEVQTEFGRELEAIMGSAARYNSANTEAFINLPWKSDELNNLLMQWCFIEELEEVPGGYFTSRNLDNAFRTVIQDDEVPREILLHYKRIIDEEIVRKRKEFGLED